MVERSVYKAPKMRELVNLRVVIESGDEHQFTALVWSNPRYLVSSGDTPVILHVRTSWHFILSFKQSRSSQCSTTGVTKAVVCVILSGMVHIKVPLLLIDKSSLCDDSGFPFSLSEWSLTICLTPCNRR